MPFACLMFTATMLHRSQLADIDSEDRGGEVNKGNEGEEVREGIMWRE